MSTDDLRALRTELELCVKNLDANVLGGGMLLVSSVMLREYAERFRASIAAIDRAIAAEGEVERWRELFGADDPEDGCIDGAQGKVIAKRNQELATARLQAESLAGALARLEPLLWLNQNPTTADHHEWNAAVLESRAALATYRAGRNAGEGAK